MNYDELGRVLLAPVIDLRGQLIFGLALANLIAGVMVAFVRDEFDPAMIANWLKTDGGKVGGWLLLTEICQLGAWAGQGTPLETLLPIGGNVAVTGTLILALGADALDKVRYLLGGVPPKALQTRRQLGGRPALPTVKRPWQKRPPRPHRPHAPTTPIPMPPAREDDHAGH